MIHFNLFKKLTSDRVEPLLLSVDNETVLNWCLENIRKGIELDVIHAIERENLECVKFLYYLYLYHMDLRNANTAAVQQSNMPIFSYIFKQLQYKHLKQYHRDVFTDITVEILQTGQTKLLEWLESKNLYDSMRIYPTKLSDRNNERVVKCVCEVSWHIIV